jgi:hypothetical protein
MVNIKAINDREITDRLTDYHTKGGAVRMSVFEISENYLGEMPDEYTAHLITARQTLEKENYECNLHINKVLPPNKRLNSTIAQTDFTKLDPSGQRIDVRDFLGPHINQPSKKGFSYETLEGHVEKGISTFTIEQLNNELIFKIQTYSTPGNFLTRLLRPVFSVPYQTFCTRKALRHVKRQIEYI